MGKIATNFNNLTQYNNDIFCISSHNDFPMAIRDLFGNDLNDLDFNSDLSQDPKFQNYNMDHTDLPKLRKGHVGGQVI